MNDLEGKVILISVLISQFLLLPISNYWLFILASIGSLYKRSNSISLKSSKGLVSKNGKLCSTCNRHLVWLRLCSICYCWEQQLAAGRSDSRNSIWWRSRFWYHSDDKLSCVLYSLRCLKLKHCYFKFEDNLDFKHNYLKCKHGIDIFDLKHLFQQAALIWY